MAWGHGREEVRARLDRELRGACGHRGPVHTEARLAGQAGVDARAWEAMSSASKGLESQEKTGIFPGEPWTGGRGPGRPH